MFGSVENRGMYLLAARIFQGLGSGVCFQARFVLAQMSTSDQHQDLQAWSFLMGDLGLGLGALLPAATSMVVGSYKLCSEAPEFAPSAVLAFISLLYLCWIVHSFPRQLHFLPHNVRFPKSKGSSPPSSVSGTQRETDKKYRKFALISSTSRVFVQSSVFCAVALLMRDADWTGHFRQCFAVAALCWLPMPFEALTSHLCCSCSTRSQRDSDGQRDLMKAKITSGAIGAAVFLGIVAWTGFGQGPQGDFHALVVGFLELAALMVALAIIAPFNASRLYGLRDAERASVILEWMKAYIGRLLSPLFAIVVYNLVGYRALLSVLCALTALATVTA